MAEQPTARCQPEVFRGQPCWRLTLPRGDTALVAEHGAQVLSWVSDGRERLFLSEASRFNGRDAIRGGVPVCWPQFNTRGPLPKHGFVRNLPWRPQTPQPADGAAAEADIACLSLVLSSSPSTLAIWPQAFEAALTVELRPGALRITLGVRNTGERPLAFTGALHSYLAVDDVTQAQLTGLHGQPEWDALADAHGSAAEVLRFPEAFDRVYRAAPEPLLLQGGAHRLVIAQSPDWAHTVVWTPGPALAAQLADMAPGSHTRMLCVEAAQVFAPITVPPRGRWKGWQQFQVL